MAIGGQGWPVNGEDASRNGAIRFREGQLTTVFVQTLPNSTKCDGLTEACRIAWMAYEHGVQWVPHGWNTAVGLAADLQLSAAMPVATYVEFLTPSPYVDEIITTPFRPDAEGYLTIPDKPGLGIELNRESLKKYGC